MSLDFVIVQVEPQARHLLCKGFLELWAFLICKDVRIINSPASHGLALDLRGEIPYVARDVVGDREEIEISGRPPPLPSPKFGEFGGGLGGGHNFQHPRGINRCAGENAATRDPIRTIRADDHLSTESTLIGLDSYTVFIRNDIPDCNT